MSFRYRPEQIEEMSLMRVRADRWQLNIRPVGETAVSIHFLDDESAHEVLQLACDKDELARFAQVTTRRRLFDKPVRRREVL